MAYGVKYRLEFSDVLGYPKKLEILKKNYSGDVLPIIGGANPVQISWQSSDDFYKSIIGSKCQLKLFVTDSVSYDDFYKFDEREYKVNVYYSKPIVDDFETRIVADNGFIESFDCLENETKFFKDSTFYQKRVFNDSGIIESLNCIESQISNNINNDFGLFWTGFLVVDRFRESLQSPPFEITLNAFDGLGTLSDFDGTVADFYSSSNNNSYNDIQRIALILQNLDLDIAINCVNDITFSSLIAGNNYGSTDSVFPYNATMFAAQELANDFDVFNAKEQLELILGLYNQRIFQSFGKWYIVEASNIFDITVKDSILASLQANNAVPTGIQNDIFNQLNSTHNERVKNRRHDYLGAIVDTINEPVVLVAPKELTPVGGDFNIEYLQPLNSVVVKSKQNNLRGEFYNSGFEYGASDWTILNSYAEVVDADFKFKGKKALRLTGTAPTTPENIKIMNFQSFGTIDVANFFEELNQFGLEFYYFVEETSGGGVEANVSFKIDLRLDFVTPSLTHFYGWDSDAKKFTNFSSSQQLPVVNNLTSSENNLFKKFSQKLSSNGIDQSPSNATLAAVTMEAFLLNTTTTASTYVTTYFDNMKTFKPDDVRSVDDVTLKTTISNATTTTTTKNFTKYLSTNTRRFFNKNLARTRDNLSVIGGSNLFKKAYEVTTQNIANDFRSFVKRYDGLFRNSRRKPLSIHNKLWVNFSTKTENEQPAIIDGLTYNVKKNQYKITSHVPNDDDDVTTTNSYR